MPLQTVSFVADKPSPPPPPPMPPGVEIALRALKWFFLAMLVPAAAGVLWMNSAFLAGASATRLQWPSAVLVGLITTVGLIVLLVAAGMTWTRLRPVSIMALALFGACLWLALQSAGGFSYFTSRPPRPEPRSLRSRPINEIRADLANAHNMCEETGDPYHCGWRPVLSRELVEARRELESPAETVSGGMMSATFSPSALAYGRYFSSWYIHYAFVAFAALCLPILSGCAYVLTQPEATASKPATPLQAKGDTEAAFERWANEYLIRDADKDTPSTEILLAYRISCASRGVPAYRTEEFNLKLAAWLRDKFKSVERENAKGIPVYVGVALIDDAISQEGKLIEAA